MSEVRLVIREAERDWSGTVHGSVADRAIAALSADPVTLAELETALGRYELPRPNRRHMASLPAGLRDEAYDAGLVVIDLVARLIVVDSTYSSPGPTGEVCYHNGHSATDTWLRYHLAEDWLFAGDPFVWSGLAAQRRRERTARPPLESRTVFYGKSLLEFIARKTFAAHLQLETMTSDVRDVIRAIHAAWLMTPREDLAGCCPREIALEGHDHLTWDLQDQSENWSLLDRSPPGLSESAFGFRYGGFGTHELVQYYELVRELLWSCWDGLEALGKTSPAVPRPAARTVGDFLTVEIPRLEAVRDAWLDGPDPECHGRTPRSIIERERARLPEGMSAQDAMVAPDCPCCQMLADMPGPAFWHLDGCNLDDDFAFDIRHRTREAWDAEQREWEDHHRRFNAEGEERKRLGVAESGFGEPGEESVWSSSFSVGDATDVPLSVRLLGIGGHLAELIVDLRENADQLPAAPDAQRLTDRLNRDFGNLREVLQSSDTSLITALIQPVIDRFGETIAEISSTVPQLSAICESLTCMVNRLLEPRPPEFLADGRNSDEPF